jgi:formate C-acetyltransferase
MKSYEAIKMLVGEPSPRMYEFQEELCTIKPSICTDRAWIVTDAYRNRLRESAVLRRAHVLRDILTRMKIFIEPHTLIAGNYTSQNRAAPVFPEHGMHWVMQELDESEESLSTYFCIDEQAKTDLKNIAPFWDTVNDRGFGSMPGFTEILFNMGFVFTNDKPLPKLTVDYGKVIGTGLKEYQRQAEHELSMITAQDHQKRLKAEFYEALIIIVEAIRDFAGRFATLADRMALDESCGRRRGELEEISRILRKVPYDPAATFNEALQSLWIIYICLRLESNYNSLLFSSMERILLPFYKRDLAEKRITEQFAGELLTNLWLKTFSISQIRP